ncbi:MAG: ATP-binding protein [Candidatus Syntropharchaeia archaeon]
MIVSIASGKGGTGKTTVAVNLALSLENVQLIDCDVEEPNDHIFLNPDIEKSEDVYVECPVIDKEKCNLCGQCASFCMYNAIAVTKNEVIVFPELCHSCGGCKLVCPRDAITYERRAIGRIGSGKAKHVEFHMGVMNPGEIRATPIVKQLKKKINREKYAILDAPPGAGCLVIEAIEDSDFCILVTEPTPFGLYDLKLAVDVVRKLKIPFGVVINKDGIGDRRVEVFCSREDIPILMKIPFDRKIADLYSKGVPFVLEMEGWKEKLRTMVDEIMGRSA